jgi:hypothetical protein
VAVNHGFVDSSEKVIHTGPRSLTIGVTDDCIDELLSGSGDPPLLQQCVATREVQSQKIRRSTLKKNTKSPVKKEQTAKRIAKARRPVQREPKEILAELVEKMRGKLVA